MKVVEFQARYRQGTSCIWSQMRFHKKQDLARTSASLSALVLFSVKITGGLKIISQLDATLCCAHFIHCSASKPKQWKSSFTRPFMIMFFRKSLVLWLLAPHICLLEHKVQQKSHILSDSC